MHQLRRIERTPRHSGKSVRHRSQVGHYGTRRCAGRATHLVVLLGDRCVSVVKEGPCSAALRRADNAI